VFKDSRHRASSGGHDRSGIYSSSRSSNSSSAGGQHSSEIMVVIMEVVIIVVVLVVFRLYKSISTDICSRKMP